VPLYPQYAAATTATVCDKAFAVLATMRWQPALRVAPGRISTRRSYIDAVATSLERALAKLPFQPERSWLRSTACRKNICARGDPYYCQCAATVRLLRERLQARREPDAHLPIALRPG